MGCQGFKVSTCLKGLGFRAQVQLQLGQSEHSGPPEKAWELGILLLHGICTSSPAHELLELLYSYGMSLIQTTPRPCSELVP